MTEKVKLGFTAAVSPLAVLSWFTVSRSVFPISSAPPPPYASRQAPRMTAHGKWVVRTTWLGWASLAAAAWAYWVSRPVTHRIDHFFGVNRARSWDTDGLIVAGFLAVLALLFSGAGLALAGTQPPGPKASARSAWSLGVLALAGLFYGWFASNP